MRSLTKWYGSTRAVDGVSFAIEPGEVFGYLGPNGSGKTTTIRCLMGLLRPTGGDCRILGETIRHGLATQHPEIGYLPGDFRIWPNLRAERALSILARLGNDGEKVSVRRKELAERLGLDLDRPVGDLSKGNRQKVGVAFAFQHRPRVLILDEPTIGLDPLVRQTVLDLIREAAGDGAAVLLSSHDLAEVAAVCGRAAIIRKGRLAELAPISSIVQQGRRRLKVWLAAGTQVPALPGDLKPVARIVGTETGVMEIAYQGAADPLLKWLARFPVERIATPETSLEEAFMQYYSNDEGDKA